jgi:hypothetical protein
MRIRVKVPESSLFFAPAGSQGGRPIDGTNPVIRRLIYRNRESERNAKNNFLTFESLTPALETCPSLQVAEPEDAGLPALAHAGRIDQRSQNPNSQK